ncbi:hypothetical protein [Hymenobacter rubidus]|uniref:hypothetical protein n=1 Tax=Hymenobacter rubidus TaxID=1441626 RepID=UPI00191F7CC8|nr:hypothetical protein [Hymenobacter rubidus]
MGLLAVPTHAQKVRDEKMTTTFHKSPLLVLAPQYKTYSVDYDLGNMVMNVNTRPVLQGLTYQPTGGDLLLHLTTKNVYITGRRLSESTTNGRYSAYNTVGYNAEAGYELRDAKTNQVLASYHRGGGTTTTQAFNSLRDLNGYLDNAFVSEQARSLLNAMTQRADFVLNPHDYKVDFSLSSVEGEAPAYATINQATTAFKALATGGTPVDKEKLLAVTSAWQQQLARANWEDKKSEINKKIGCALLENLCAAALLVEDYAKLGTYAGDYVKYNKGFLNSAPVSFEAETSYGGLAYTHGTATFLGRDLNTRVRVNYEDLVADMKP